MNKKSLLLAGIGVVLVGLDMTKASRTKRLVENVWNEIKDDLARELNLPKVPALEFCTLSNSIMSTEHTYTYKGLFEKRIVNTESTFIIKIDLNKVYDLITFYKHKTLKPFSGIEKAIVKQLLAHECRHIYQANGDFYVGTKIDMFGGLFDGYGNQRHEVDANEFAICFADNNKEKIVAIYQKKCQEHCGTIAYNKGYTFDGQKELLRKLRKAYR